MVIYIWYFHKKTKFLKLLSSQTGICEQILRGLKIISLLTPPG